MDDVFYGAPEEILNQALSRVECVPDETTTVLRAAVKELLELRKDRERLQEEKGELQAELEELKWEYRLTRVAAKEEARQADSNLDLAVRRKNLHQQIADISSVYPGLNHLLQRSRGVGETTVLAKLAADRGAAFIVMTRLEGEEIKKHLGLPDLHVVPVGSATFKLHGSKQPVILDNSVVEMLARVGKTIFDLAMKGLDEDTPEVPPSAR